MDKLAINRRTALKIYWDAGFEGALLKVAANELDKLKMVTEGYYMADDVVASCDSIILNLIKT